MFVPVEAAFSVGVQSDETLIADAFSRNIVIVTPTTMLVTLRTIENIWRYERQSANAQEIAKRAGGLYDKLVGFFADMEVIGNRLQSVQSVYDDAVRKLSSGRGNLIRRAESMRQLGAESSKSLPKSWVETDEAPLIQSLKIQTTIIRSTNGQAVVGVIGRGSQAVLAKRWIAPICGRKPIRCSSDIL